MGRCCLFRLVICCHSAVSLYFISQSLGFYTCGCEAMAPISGYNNHRHLFTTTLAISKKKDDTTGTNANSVPYAQKRQEFMRSIRQKIDELVTGTLKRTKVCTRSLQHALYWMTALDAITSVIRNEYSDIFGVGASQNQGVVQGVYSMLFYFARMRPRLLYSIGALVRALSLCTPLQYLIDPSVGVGAGIHLFAYLTGSRWVKPLILGWATTKAFWTWLGARPIERAYVPITLSIHEWEDKKAKRDQQQKQKQ